MKKFETAAKTRVEEEENKFGVLGYKIEKDHYVVSIRWKDGQVNEHHFPVKGFPVINPATGEFIKKNLPGKDDLEILRENAGNMTADEFSWLDFVGSDLKK